MSIDFHKKGNNQKSEIFHLSDSLYDELQIVFDEFRRKTGVFIDPYGKVTLLPENAKLIGEIVLNLILQKKLTHNKPVKDFLSFLDMVYKEDIVILAVGD